MKGERIVAELLGILGLLVYGALLQHIYSQMLGHPDQSWFNQGKAWWLTRRSRAKTAQVAKIWNLKESAIEPEA